MKWYDMIWMNDSLNYWTGLHQPNCAELLRTLPHTYCWPMGLDVRWVKVAGGCQLWRGALVDAWISWDWIWKKQCHIPPMTGNGLYPTYLWWFVGMVVIIVLPTVNFLGVITHMETYQPTTISWEVFRMAQWMGRLQVRPWAPWHPHMFAAPRLPKSLATRALSWRYNQWTPIEPQSCVVTKMSSY